jgi:hypothetical protein
MAKQTAEFKKMINFGKAKGGKTMKKRQTLKKIGLGLSLVALMVLAILSTQAQAQAVDCTAPSAVADFDGDGFSDQQECMGITLFSGAVVNTNPEIPDLFVILVRATDIGESYTNIPEESDPNYFDPLEFVSNPIDTGGLGFTTHLIPFSEADLERFVSPGIPQKAVRITEDLDPNGIVLGVANQGTPNGLDEASIFTERIKNHVQSTCAEADPPLSDNCTDKATGFSGQDLIDLYIRHTIAHEIGHMTMLAVDYNRRFGGYHYKAGSEVILEQAVKYTSKKGKVTFYISTQYSAPSQLGVQLQ